MPTRSTSRSVPRFVTPCGTPAGAQTTPPVGRGAALVADDEVAHSLDDEVELVLAGVVVELLLLPRRKAVQPQHQRSLRHNVDLKGLSALVPTWLL